MRIDSLLDKDPHDNRTTPPHILPIYATSSFSFESIEQAIHMFSNIESGHT